MGASQTGIAQIGSYDSGNINTDIAELIALIPDPDSTSTSGAQGGGGNLDEMSPAAAAQLLVELDAIGGGADSGFASGTYTAVAADDTAGLVDIDTGLDDLTAGQWAVTIWRSGSIVQSDQAVTENSAGVIRVADGASTYDVTAGDIIVWYAYT